MRLKLVVFPAPLGPISATVSPSPTVRLSSWTARNPPNRLLRLRTTSASAIEQGLFLAHRAGRGDPPVRRGQQSKQAGRPPQNHGHQDEGVDRQLDAAMTA